MLTIRGVALVTGAASGIGKACALSYAKAGVRSLALCDISSSRLRETLAEAKAVATNKDFDILTETVDVRDEQAINNFVSTSKSAFGRIDYAANIAGISGELHKTANVPTKEFDHVHAINNRGVFLCMRAQLQVMQSQEALVHLAGRPAERGSVINMSSLLGHVALAGFDSYGIAKHAVIGMTRNAAVAHGEDGIRVNAVCPGFTETPMVTTPEMKESARKLAMETVMKRFGKPEEIADIVLFLSSAEASFVTGQNWIVDGGKSVVY